MHRARTIVTAHADVARHWRTRQHNVVQLSWCVAPVIAHPRRQRIANEPALVVFPASALARKGAYELAAALSGVKCRLRVLGSFCEDPALWHGIDVHYGRYTDDWLEHADLVVLPAHVEHSPRALLQALAAQIPVIATSACGLVAGTTGLNLVPASDVLALRRAIVDLL